MSEHKRGLMFLLFLSGMRNSPALNAGTIPRTTLFNITSLAGVVPCGGPKKSPRTSSIEHIIFSFWSFEISEDILRNQKFIIG